MSKPQTAPVPAAAAQRFALTEDWVATIVGLLLVSLTALGVITNGIFPL